MLQLKGICVNYSYKTVLTGINLNFEAGKIYSLLGENGAGKSTLAHVLCGDIRQTAGQIVLDGKTLKIKNPEDAIKSGIVCVHQRPLLASSISILENLKIGINKSQEKEIPKLAEKWIPDLKLSELVKNLNEQETFYTSLTGALLKNPKILILDEPPFLESSKINELAESGITIIIITHSFKEALEKSDEIILLQDGIVIEKTPSSKITEEDIKQKLFGLTQTIQMPENIIKENITETEILKIRNNPNRSEKNVTGFIPSDRTFCASNPNLSILQLLTIYHTNLKQAELKEYAEALLRKADVNIKLDEKASCLSGGMLQRLILERELAENPDTLYLFNPTHGLDAEATERLYQKLKSLSKNDTKVIIGTEQ